MKKILFLFLLLPACSTTKAVIGPDGTEHQLVKCAGIEGCYEKAREVCGGNYKIVNTSTDTSGGSESSVSTTTNLLVKCEK